MNSTNSHLVPVKPGQFKDFVCPACASADVAVKGTVFPGIHVMGAYTCTSCGLEFLRDLPVGFAVDHPMAIGRKDGTLFNPTNGEYWLHGPLLAAFRKPSDAAVRVERVVNRQSSKVIILNTLDFLYGHVLLKLFNAQQYIDLYPDQGLILIVPRMFAWLVPKGVAEAWIVDLKLGAMHGWYPALDAFVQEQLVRFDEVAMARGYAHPDVSTLDIGRYSGVPAFPQEEFTTRVPWITFIAREDRLWHASPICGVLHRVARKLGLRRMGVAAQDRLIARTIELIRREVPSAHFAVTGLGSAGGLGAHVGDLRIDRMSDERERTWCETYARSQVVIGVHGSNMLLPTAHAAGCIEILPSDRLGNIVQDIAVRYADRRQLFLYRFVREHASPKEVAQHAVSMFKHHDLYMRNNLTNVF